MTREAPVAVSTKSTLRTPSGLWWHLLGPIAHPDGTIALAWIHLATNTQVLSAVEIAEQPRSGTPGPQWHISVVDRTTREPRRPSDSQFRLARCAFGMLAAEEDNHHPGNARHLWMPFDPTERVDCECKTEEVVVTDADGYQWTNPADGPCRGCEHAATMRSVGLERPCPLHRQQSELTR